MQKLLSPREIPNPARLIKHSDYNNVNLFTMLTVVHQDFYVSSLPGAQGRSSTLKLQQRISSVAWRFSSRPSPARQLPPESSSRCSSSPSYLTSVVVLAQKSQKWVQMQRKRYGEKRKGGYVDMGKQVCTCISTILAEVHKNHRISLPGTSERLSRTTEVQE